jgi:hypothetical protein
MRGTAGQLGVLSDSSSSCLAASRCRARTGRWAATGYAILLAISASLVVIGAMVEPSEAWYGTHERLGLPPCLAPRVTGGYPCATCGFTTAVARMARLEVVQALYAHPFGAVALAGAVALLVWTAAAAAMRRSPLAAWGVLRSPWCWGGMIALYFGSWAMNLALVAAGIKAHPT